MIRWERKTTPKNHDTIFIPPMNLQPTLPFIHSHIEFCSNNYYYRSVLPAKKNSKLLLPVIAPSIAKAQRSTSTVHVEVHVSLVYVIHNTFSIYNSHIWGATPMCQCGSGQVSISDTTYVNVRLVLGLTFQKCMHVMLDILCHHFHVQAHDRCIPSCVGGTFLKFYCLNTLIIPSSTSTRYRQACTQGRLLYLRWSGMWVRWSGSLLGQL